MDPKFEIWLELIWRKVQELVSPQSSPVILQWRWVWKPHYSTLKSICKGVINGEGMRWWPVCWDYFLSKRPGDFSCEKNIGYPKQVERLWEGSLILRIVHFNCQGILLLLPSIPQGGTTHLVEIYLCSPLPSFIPWLIINWVTTVKHTMQVLRKMYRKMRCGTIP